MICGVRCHSEHTTKCTYVDSCLHFPAVCIVWNALEMDRLINPKHVAQQSD